MAMIPIKISADREVIICGRRVGNISDKRIDKIFVVSDPGWVQISNYSCSIDEISIMEMMIVVICISEIIPWITCHIRGTRNNTSPSSFIYKRECLYIVREDCEGCF
jgi:hypothetical protein